MNEEAEAFYLKKEQIPEDTNSDYNYEEVPVDDEFAPHEAEEELNLIVDTIREASLDQAAAIEKDGGIRPSVTRKPEVVDDFVRNFLVRMSMLKTLNCFQTEWYELQQKGVIRNETSEAVPDVYIANQLLDTELNYQRKEVERFRDAALKAKETYVRLRKERDYHKMHHKRVVQEKNKLITDLKRLKNHYQSYEPTLRQLKQKYESAMKEKMLTKLERDRAVGQMSGLQNTIKGIEGYSSANKPADEGNEPQSLSVCQRGSAVMLIDEQGLGPTQRRLKEERENQVKREFIMNLEGDKHPEDSKFPPDTGVNPRLSQVKSKPGHVTRTGGFRPTNHFAAHSCAISSVALHPKKQVLATTSDDQTWKLWAIPSGEIIMTGKGHTDWLANCDFHPTGSKLATVSGDTTVKIWHLAQSECLHTFTEHTHAVWGCSWHTCGDFLATCSMDNTSKIWDLSSMRCRYTLRGHADSVNSIEFLPYSNTLVSCSADKTISLWDARNGLCAQTFYGHMHSVNDAKFNLRGDTVASCDSYGVLKLWDVRTVSVMASVDLGPHPANKFTFDSSGSVIGVASNDTTVKMYDLSSGQVTSLVGHDDAVQCVVFDYGGEFLISGGSDRMVRIWS